jgi:hypothetical protein
MHSLLDNAEFDFDKISSKTVINDNDCACMSFSVSLRKKIKRKFYFYNI